MYSEEMLDDPMNAIRRPSDHYGRRRCQLVVPRGVGGWWYLIWSYIRRLESFLGFKILKINIFFWVFRINEYFLGYENFVDIFWGDSQFGLSLVLGVISRLFLCILGSMYRIGIFFRLQKILIFLGC